MACDVGIGGVLNQENHPIAFSNEKLNKTKQRYDVYDRELYDVVQSLRYWHHYLLSTEFVLYSDHQALYYINSHKRVGRHIKWFEFIQEYTFILKHHASVDNKAIDDLSWRLCTLQALSAEVIGFECLIQDYPTCRDFGEIYTSLIWDPPL